ncbi:phage holin [Virgibacillus sp. NKC19-3]|uniref:phage holin n=1 Tax=Virgibacillus saliphilus TaxID=2831674 RepID=UPI001C9AE700|nr:phage holin [Virgibacillus sp. NKC19-3]MBY7143816.1 phage holin [Virgibacillus sp. NKC19-3]
MDKGTIIRTIALLVALINQILVLFDKSPLPIDSVFVEQFFSVLFTVIASLIAWFKNNYVTKKGQRQKEALLEKGLTRPKK